MEEANRKVDQSGIDHESQRLKRFGRVGWMKLKECSKKKYSKKVQM